jgi:hypothetical protein
VPGSGTAEGSTAGEPATPTVAPPDAAASKAAGGNPVSAPPRVSSAPPIANAPMTATAISSAERRDGERERLAGSGPANGWRLPVIEASLPCPASARRLADQAPRSHSAIAGAINYSSSDMRSWLASARPGFTGAGQFDGGTILTVPGTGAPGRPGDDDAVPASVRLGPREELIAALRGIGSTMLLTNTRIVVARDGLERRPRSGFQSFPLSAIDRIGIEAGIASGRVIVWTGPVEEGVSMFFAPGSLDRAETLVAEARPRIARSRRGIPDPGAQGNPGAHR